MARNSIRSLSLSEGKVLDPGLMVGDELSDLIATSILLRLTGRVDMWHQYQLSLRTSGSKTDIDGTISDSLICGTDSITAFFRFVLSTLTKGNPACSISHWISDQFASSLPTAVKESYSRFRQFALGVLAGIPLLVHQLTGLISSPQPSRTEAVSLIDQVLSVNWGGERLDETRRHRLFFAHMITADIEEIYSLPFGNASETHYGYGGMQGFQVMHSTAARASTRTDYTEDIMPTPRSKRKRYLHRKGDTVVSDLIMTFLRFLQIQSDGELSMMGLKRKVMIGVPDQLVVSYNERVVGFVDIEHMACKLQIGISRTRGSRAYSQPTSIPYCCYPCRYGPLYPISMKECFSDAVASHIECCLSGQWRQVPVALEMARFGSSITPISNVITKANTSILDKKRSNQVMSILLAMNEFLQRLPRNDPMESVLSHTSFWDEVSIQTGVPNSKDSLADVFGLFGQSEIHVTR
jgi:hypothetical protein